MRVDVVTIFPDMLDAVSKFGVSRRAVENGVVALKGWNPRDFVSDNYRTIDDRPYGGGPGMVMLAEPLERVLDVVAEDQSANGIEPAPVVYMSPQGQVLTHALVKEMSAWPAITVLAGRYEGVDQRLVDARVTREISVGDYVLSGGELPALVLIDAIVRLLPGVLGDAGSAEQDSFADGLLDCPHYTRPEVYRGMAVPEVLLSGNHARIRRWRLKQALGRTWQRRPDLLAGRTLTKEESRLLAEFQQEQDIQNRSET